MKIEFIQRPMILIQGEKLENREFIVGIHGCIIIAGEDVVITGCAFVSSSRTAAVVTLSPGVKNYTLANNSFTLHDIHKPNR